MANSFREVVDLWSSPDALAQDIGAKVETVRKWRQRDSIPAEWWLAVIAAARKREAVLTAGEMAEMAARRTEPVEAAE